MALAPQNIRTVDDQIDGTYVKIVWDDPNSPAASAAKFFTPDGQWEQPVTYDLATRTAMVRGSMMMLLKTPDGSQSSKVAFTAVPLPPVPLTARQHLEAAVGALENDSQVAVYPEPSAVLTVNADGTVTPA
jgi:hypothetical protein